MSSDIEDIEDLYQKLVNAGFSEQEIEKKVRKKSEEYQGFMSKEAILFLVAKECGLEVRSPNVDPEVYQEIEEGIDYDEFAIEISDITEGMSNIVALGRIEKAFGTRSFLRKDGTPGIVGSFLMNDGSGRVKIVLWGEQVKVIESEYFREGETVRVLGGYSKVGLNDQIEVHMGRKGKIMLAPKDIDRKKIPLLDKIPDSKEKSSVKIRDVLNNEGFVKKISGIVSGIEQFKELTLKNGEKSFLLKFILSDDETSARVVVWGMSAVDCLKLISEGDTIELYKVVVKFNDYTGEKELSFVKNSELKIII